MEEKKFQPFVPADKVVPEFTVFSVVLGMLLEVCLQGWTDTAHLDQDFHNVSVTIAVLPPDD